MYKKTNLNIRGFTLIEVVLVLAIGGLIFLLAFIAFNQVATNRRDTQRRNDASRIVSELQNYFTNGGNVSGFRTVSFWKGSSPDSSPADACGSDTDPFIASFSKTYLCNGTSFKSPSGSNYRIATAGATLTEPGDFWFLNGNCTDLAPNKQSIKMKLEKGEVCREL